MNNLADLGEKMGADPEKCPLHAGDQVGFSVGIRFKGTCRGNNTETL